MSGRGGKWCVALTVAAASVPCLPAYAQAPVAEFQCRHIENNNNIALRGFGRRKGGALVAVGLNPTNRGRKGGDADYRGGVDGLLWRRLRTIAQHKPRTNRVNHAAGFNVNGDCLPPCKGGGGWL